MQSAAIPENESERLHELNTYQLLDTAPDEAFDELADLAAEICDVPVALISLVDENRQWFKAKVGLEVEETARSVSFCAHAILQPSLFTVNDTLLDDRFRDNPLVTGEPNIRFYSGVPLFSPGGLGLGTLCVIDKKPRELTLSQQKALQMLAKHVNTLMELRRQNIRLRGLNRELELFTSAVSHDLVAPMRRISGFTEALMQDHAAELSDTACDLVYRAHNACKTLETSVDKMLLLSRVVTTGLRITKIDLTRMAQEQIALLQLAEPDRKTNIIIEDDLYLFADKDLTRSLVDNLLSNAWKFSVVSDVTEIRVGRTVYDGKPMFYVQDNGIGFTCSNEKDLFRPFSRLHKQNLFPGSGIGLATVDRIVRRHGGELHAESSEGKGATFYFSM